MKTDQELDDLLRATFAARAELVRRAAAVPELRHRRPWWPALAAAAAVVLIAAGIVVGNHVTRTNHPTHPSPHPATTTHTSAPTVPTACATPLPAAWKQAILTSRVDFGSMAATVDDIGTDGTLVVSRDFGVTPGSARDIVLVKPGKAPRVVYRVADPDKYDATAAIDGHRLVIAVNSHGRAPANSIPNFPQPTILQLQVRDLRTGTTRQIASAPEGDGAQQVPLIEAFAVFNGRVYWTYRNAYGSSTGEIRSFDLSTGQTSTVYRGPLSDYPQVSDGGIGDWPPGGGSRRVAADLPTQVAMNLDPANQLVVATDGHAWAWAKSSHVLGWWQPGMASPRYLQLKQDLSSNTVLLTVTGPYAFVAEYVVDTRTGAIASLVGSGLPSGKLSSFEPQVGHGGTVYGFADAGTGHWVDGHWQDPQPQVQRVDTTKLPGLHC